MDDKKQVVRIAEGFIGIIQGHKLHQEKTLNSILVKHGYKLNHDLINELSTYYDKLQSMDDKETVYLENQDHIENEDWQDLGKHLNELQRSK